LEGNEGGAPWSRRFRVAALTAGLGAVVWTILMILPVEPFSSIPPVLVGGGPGIWLLLGYLMYIVGGFGGLSILSSMLYPLERDGSWRPDGAILGLGLALFYAGVTCASVLLGLAGFTGGYAYSIDHAADTSIVSILQPYVGLVTFAALAASAGAAIVLSLLFLGEMRTRRSGR